MTVGVFTPRVVLRRDVCLDVDHAVGDRIDRIFQQIGNQGIEVAGVDLGFNDGVIGIGQRHRRTCHRDRLIHGPTERIALHADSTAHVEHWRVDNGNGCSIDGIGGFAGGI